MLSKSSWNNLIFKTLFIAYCWFLCSMLVKPYFCVWTICNHVSFTLANNGSQVVLAGSGQCMGLRLIRAMGQQCIWGHFWSMGHVTFTVGHLLLSRIEYKMETLDSSGNILVQFLPDQLKLEVVVCCISTGFRAWPSSAQTQNRKSILKAYSQL